MRKNFSLLHTSVKKGVQRKQILVFRKRSQQFSKNKENKFVFIYVCVYSFSGKMFIITWRNEDSLFTFFLEVICILSTSWYCYSDPENQLQELRMGVFFNSNIFSKQFNCHQAFNVVQKAVVFLLFESFCENP